MVDIILDPSHRLWYYWVSRTCPPSMYFLRRDALGFTDLI